MLPCDPEVLPGMATYLLPGDATPLDTVEHPFYRAALLSGIKHVASLQI